jgi:hypothetical protein
MVNAVAHARLRGKVDDHFRLNAGKRFPPPRIRLQDRLL